MDPSYLELPLLNELARHLRGTWTALYAAAERQLRQLTTGGTLPSDWAVIGSNYQVDPSSPPNETGAQVIYGFDAVRVPIWLASSCAVADRRSAASLLPALERGQGQVELDLGGRPDPGVSTPVAWVGESAAAEAAGDASRSRNLLALAYSEYRSSPTYYAAAVLAVAGLSIEHRLGSC